MERGSVNYYTGSCQHGYKFRFQNSRGKLQQCCSFNTGNYNGNFNYIDGNSRYDSTCNIAGSSTTSNVNFTITADDGASSHFIENQLLPGIGQRMLNQVHVKPPVIKLLQEAIAFQVLLKGF